MTKSRYLLFFYSFVLMLIFLHLNQYVYISDDLWFSETSRSQTDHIQWVIARYYGWSSRTPIEYALISLINHYNIWSILNAAIFAIFITSMCSVAKTFAKEYYVAVPVITILISIYSMPKDIFFDGAIWVTGSFNYLWPVSFALLGYAILINYLQHMPNNRNKIYLCSAAFLLSSFNEQIAVTNFIVTLAIIIYCVSKRKSAKIPLLMLLLTALVILYIATCPGNKARYGSEIARWFVGYSDFNIIQKSLLGLNIYADALFSHKTIVPAIAAFSLALICKNRLKLFPLAAGFILLLIAGVYNAPGILTKVQYTAETIYSTTSLLRVFYAFVITSMMILPVIISRKSENIAFLVVALFMSAAASASMLGFSPTVYASGDRILFITYILLTLISVISCTEFTSKIWLNNNAKK